jgi:hypothetical protein
MSGPADRMPVFVNDALIWLPVGASASVAVASFDATLGARLSAGSAYLTDGRGIRLAADAPVHSGAILRVIVSARRGEDGTDAQP